MSEQLGPGGHYQLLPRVQLHILKAPYNLSPVCLKVAGERWYYQVLLDPPSVDCTSVQCNIYRNKFQNALL